SLSEPEPRDMEEDPIMKVQLTVLTAGPRAGTTIGVTHFPFLIGRDPTCQLRPNSPAVAPRQCALVERSDKVFVRGFGIAAGTRLNGHKLDNEEELHSGDQFEVGPLVFGVNIEDTSAAQWPTEPPSSVAGNLDEDSIAAWLLEPLEEKIDPATQKTA